MGFGENIGLSGLSRASIKKYPAVIPIYVMLGIGVALAATASLRTLFKHPEIVIAKQSNPEPWNAYTDKQYKVFASGRDYKESVSQAPKF